MHSNKKPGHDSRIERALQYIESNLENSLTLEQVAAAAAVSRYHFHRVFADNVGYTVGDYIRLQRMKRAAFQLAFHGEKPITEIAFDACYSTPEAFSKAFRKATGLSPTAFRRRPDFSLWSREIHNQPTREYRDMTVEIRKFEETAVAVLEHKGPMAQIQNTLRQFIAWRKENGPSPSRSRTFNIYYDDPEMVAAKDYRMDIGAEIRSSLKPNDYGIVRKVIPDLECAVLRHHGSWDDLGAAMRYLYADWLPACGRELDDFPMFVERVNLYPETVEADLITDIYLPLATGRSTSD